jgi:L-asparaginase
VKITVLNTGGTFNKRYNPISGQLEVPSDNIALDKIVKSCFNIEFEIKNIVSKDSLDFTQEDRETILENIINSENDKIIIIHGTDTVDLTAKFIEDKIENKKVVFTGAMIPMSIDEVEATMNFSQAIGFLNAPIKNGIYLSMHGSVIEHSKLKKDRSVGQFLVKN